MDDLISRQAAIDALEKVANLFPYRVPGDWDTYGTYNEAWNDAIGRAEMEMETVPSVQPEIIRCKDCKHYAGEGMYCACDIIVHYDHFYCYYAERRTDG